MTKTVVRLLVDSKTVDKGLETLPPTNCKTVVGTVVGNGDGRAMEHGWKTSEDPRFFSLSLNLDYQPTKSQSYTQLFPVAVLLAELQWATNVVSL